MSKLNTSDPIALRYLMNETVFGIVDDARDLLNTGQSVNEPVIKWEEAPNFVFYGKNKRNYLFLTQEKQHEWMSATALEAFTKTLAALKLSTDDIALLNVSKLLSFPEKADVVAFFKPKVVISLGITLRWEGGDDRAMRVFQTHSFDEMLVDAEKKRIFWTTVKTLLT